MSTKPAFSKRHIIVLIMLLAVLAGAARIHQHYLKQQQIQLIRYNLQQIASAGQQVIMEDGLESVEYRDLEWVWRSMRLTAIAGEDYSSLVIHPQGELSVTTDDGVIVTFDY